MICVPVLVIVAVPKNKYSNNSRFKIVNDYSEETILMRKQSNTN
jgi:hypothetical protein